MKKIMDKFKAYFKVNKHLFLFLSLLLIIGITSGAIFSIILKNEDLNLIKEYLSNYLDSIDKTEINMNEAFFSSFFNQLIVIIIIWVLGFSLIGIPIIFIIYFYKCFIFGFTIGSIIINYKTKGLLLSIIYMFPHHIIKLLLMTILIIYAYQLSLKIFNAVLRKKEISFKNITTNYFTIFIITIFFEIFLSIYGSYIVPKLIKMIIPMIS